MLESIISPGTAERNPWDMIILGIIVSSIAVWMGHALADLLNTPPAMLILAITVIALAPLLYRVILIEEEKEELCCTVHPLGFFTRHLDVISMYSFLFVGLLISFTFWYVALPYEDTGIVPDSSEAFCLQEEAITGVRHQITGKATDSDAATAAANARAGIFGRLYDNNFRIMLLCFFASLMFGAGSLWLITWNASVISVAIGMELKRNLVSGLCYPLGMSLWAIPEILAYLVAAFAGAIISVAVIRHHYKTEGFWLTFFDGLFFLLIALFLVFIGAWIEAYVPRY